MKMFENAHRILMLPLLGAVVALSLQGCAVLMSSNLPKKRPPERLCVGLDRDYVDKHYGYPVAATAPDDEGAIWEKICFVDGLSDNARHTRQIVHASLDVCTYYIWEVIGTPFELCAWAIGYPEYVYYLKWDKDGKLIRVVNSADVEGITSCQNFNWKWTLPPNYSVDQENMVRNLVIDCILKKDDMEEVLSSLDHKGALPQKSPVASHSNGNDLYRIERLALEHGSRYTYSFELEITTENRDFATIRKIREEFRRCLFDDYSEQTSNGQVGLVDILQWNVCGGRIGGRADIVSTGTIKPEIVHFGYDPHSRRGKIKVKVNAALTEGVIRVVREFAKKAVEDLAREKNILLTVGVTPEAARYTFEEEVWLEKTMTKKFRVE